MRTISQKVFTIDDHPNKDACFEWIRENWHDLNQHSVDELVDSLKAIANELGGSLDYSISLVPDRGEFISIKDIDKTTLNGIDAGECEFTGVFWDAEIIGALKAGELERVLDILHSETEYVYSDEGLLDFCECNECEFLEDGSIYC